MPPNKKQRKKADKDSVKAFQKKIEFKTKENVIKSELGSGGNG